MNETCSNKPSRGNALNAAAITMQKKKKKNHGPCLGNNSQILHINSFVAPRLLTASHTLKGSRTMLVSCPLKTLQMS